MKTSLTPDQASSSQPPNFPNPVIIKDPFVAATLVPFLTAISSRSIVANATPVTP